MYVSCQDTFPTFSLQKIKHIKYPKLIFHSIDDEIVPFEFGKTVFNAAAEPKGFVELHGGHNDAFLTSKEIFIREIDSFVNRLWSTCTQQCKTCLRLVEWTKKVTLPQGHKKI